jgi:di/tripeptidase
MVTEKNSDVAHDFASDPLKLSLGQDGWLRAVGTTLGAGGCAAGRRQGGPCALCHASTVLS